MMAQNKLPTHAQFLIYSLFSSHFKKYLQETTRSEFCEQYSVNKSLVREIHNTVFVRLGCNPLTHERKQIAVGLVREYPVVG